MARGLISGLAWGLAAGTVALLTLSQVADYRQLVGPSLGAPEVPAGSGFHRDRVDRQVALPAAEEARPRAPRPAAPAASEAVDAPAAASEAAAPPPAQPDPVPLSRGPETPGAGSDAGSATAADPPAVPRPIRPLAEPGGDAGPQRRSEDVEGVPAASPSRLDPEPGVDEAPAPDDPSGPVPPAETPLPPAGAAPADVPPNPPLDAARPTPAAVPDAPAAAEPDPLAAPAVDAAAGPRATTPTAPPAAMAVAVPPTRHDAPAPPEELGPVGTEQVTALAPPAPAASATPPPTAPPALPPGGAATALLSAPGSADGDLRAERLQDRPPVSTHLDSRAPSPEDTPEVRAPAPDRTDASAWPFLVAAPDAPDLTPDPAAPPEEPPALPVPHPQEPAPDALSRTAALEPKAPVITSPSPAGQPAADNAAPAVAGIPVEVPDLGAARRSRLAPPTEDAAPAVSSPQVARREGPPAPLAGSAAPDEAGPDAPAGLRGAALTDTAPAREARPGTETTRARVPERLDLPPVSPVAGPPAAASPAASSPPDDASPPVQPPPPAEMGWRAQAPAGEEAAAPTPTQPDALPERSPALVPAAPSSEAMPATMGFRELPRVRRGAASPVAANDVPPLAYRQALDQEAALVTNAAVAQPAPGPLIGVLLVADGDAVADLPAGLSIAVEADVDAAQAEAWRAAGHELVLVPRDTAGETAFPIRSALSADLESVPAAAVLATDAVAGDDLRRLASALTESGHGLVLSGPRVAPLSSLLPVPAMQIDRVVSAEAGADDLRQALDRAALVARRDGGVLMAIEADEEALSVMRDWRGRGVGLAPVSSLLRRLGES